MSNTGRKTFSKGQMTRSANSGPAVMLMPPHIRETFMPNPPLKHIPPVQKKRKNAWTGMSQYLVHFERNPPPERVIQPVPKVLREMKQNEKRKVHELELLPMVEDYRKEQRESGGIFQGMNCYNTLFVGRLAYEVTERKLLREFEMYGAIKDIKLVKDKDGKSRGYAFVEFELEEDMKRAYRAADGIKIEGRYIVVDVERGHTVPSWLPRRLGGGLGGTRLGGKGMNVTAPGRFDPSRVEVLAPIPGGPPPIGMGRGGPIAPVMGYGDSRGGGGPVGYPDAGYRGGPPSAPPPSYGRGRGSGSAGGGGDRYGSGGGGSRDWDRGGGGSSRYGEGSGGDWNRGKRPRSRSRSPDRRHSSRSRRY